jgi:acyl carrier protein
LPPAIADGILNSESGSHKGPQYRAREFMADIESAIFDIVAQQAKVERSSLKHDTELSSIELDSIDILEIIFDIEEEFNISILYNANQVPGEGGGFKTACDVIDFIKIQINEGAQIV